MTRILIRPESEDSNPRVENVVAVNLTNRTESAYVGFLDGGTLELEFPYFAWNECVVLNGTVLDVITTVEDED